MVLAERQTFENALPVMLDPYLVFDEPLRIYCV